MFPFESTTRQVGAGVSGTLKSSETRSMLLPFSVLCVTVPVLALGPWKGPDVWDSTFAKAPPARTAASAQTDSKRLNCCISVLLQFWFVFLWLRDLNGM